jgi:hypothetical protein
VEYGISRRPVGNMARLSAFNSQNNLTLVYSSVAFKKHCVRFQIVVREMLEQVRLLDDGYKRRLGRGMRQAIRPAVAMSVCRVRIHGDVTCAHSGRWVQAAAWPGDEASHPAGRCHVGVQG